MQVIGRSARMARHHKRHESAEINLTSMIDMMTILVFFLLVHGGFIRLAVLQLNLPSAQSAAQPEPPAFNAVLRSAWHYTRGLSFAAIGQMSNAESELQRLRALADDPAMKRMGETL